MKRFLVLCLALVICLLPLSGLTEAAGTVSADYVLSGPWRSPTDLNWAAPSVFRI